MKNNTLIIAVVTFLIGGIGGYTLSQMNMVFLMTTEKQNVSVPAGMHRMSDGSLMGNENSHTCVGMMCSGKDMMQGMDHSMMMVSSEKEFITEMIPHHQEAIDTAREVLARGATTPEMRTLVENIIIAQEKEIVDMKLWYQEWYSETYQPSGNYMPMMRDLSELSGQDIDRAFLEDMVVHHMGAIMMAHSVQSYIEHNEINELSEAIISSQSSEISQMRQILKGL